MRENNEPAFPCPMDPCDDHGGFTEVRFTGRTIRDYFAAQALQGMLSYSPANPPNGDYNSNCSPEAAAKQAYIYADAMMKARNK